MAKPGRPKKQAAEPAGLSEEQIEDELLTAMAGFYDDPYGFVMFAFDWGHGELADEDGPDTWQREQLEGIGKHLRENPADNFREATASGHGSGKTALTAWIILWAMSTRPQLNGVVTANTLSQLSNKTWRELALWHKRAINKHWFRWAATKFMHVQDPETWYIAAVPNSEHNSEAFAGLHSAEKLIIFDEASGIPDKIWEVTEGAMSDGSSIWLVYGNPTKNTGKFRNCFDKDKRWRTRNIDTRTVKRTDKQEIADMIEAYGGEDTDPVRVRVRGLFPKAASTQFMPIDLVSGAMARELPIESHFMMPIVVGADVARYGDDKSVIAVRQGRKLLELKTYSGLDTMTFAHQVSVAIRKFKPIATFVDVVGIGAGVVDRLRMLGYDIIEVNGGTKAREEDRWADKRAEMWVRMREWLEGADIPDHQELYEGLIGVQYFFDDKERLRLERKADMKKRDLKSPDEADAIALTFAEPLGDTVARSFEPEEESFEPEF
jgi:hypothetical protein